MILQNSIRNFSPIWGASLMGTGMLSVILGMVSQENGTAHIFALIFLVINILVFLVISIFWFARWILYFPDIKKDLMNPMIVTFFPTYPIGVIILAKVFLLSYGFIISTETSILIAKILWIVGSLLVVVLNFIIIAIMFIHKSINLDHATNGWLIPEIGLLMVSAIGCDLVPLFPEFIGHLLFYFCFFAFGAGFFIYLFFNTILINRYVYRELPPVAATPTIWIGLGPIGASIFAINKLAHVITKIKVLYLVFNDVRVLAEVFQFISIALYGLGLFWLILAIILTLYQLYINKMRLPYVMGWWSFTFPIGSFCAATIFLNRIFNFVLFDILAIFMFILLIFFWSITSVNTVSSILKSKPIS
ncbi:MAG: hypothetical protein DRH57_03880 [Candidatus Cloacimonadota bacterium]|nr:MAG: hypothetical protein DRH57_03880 [Candidatus Cloacimonadota bacterium]